MKEALQLCSLAVNSNPTTPGAGMVKVHRGMMAAFGGEFCIQAPVEVDVECAFNPESAKVFFRKDRKGFSVTIKGNKLEFKEKREKLRTGFLPPEEVVLLDCLGKPERFNVDLTTLKNALGFVDPNCYKEGVQGLRFESGLVQATDTRRLFMEVGDFSEDFAFTIPIGACVALVKTGLKIEGVCEEQSAVKFFLEGGVTLTSLKLILDYPDLNKVMVGSWTVFPMSPGFCSDAEKIAFNRVNFEGTSATMIMENDDEIEFSKVTEVDQPFSLDKRSFDLLSKNSKNFRKFNGLIQTTTETSCAVAVSRYL